MVDRRESNVLRKQLKPDSISFSLHRECIVKNRSWVCGAQMKVSADAAAMCEHAFHIEELVVHGN
jgi:hypothetical protein